MQPVCSTNGGDMKNNENEIGVSRSRGELETKDEKNIEAVCKQRRVQVNNEIESIKKKRWIKNAIPWSILPWQWYTAEMIEFYWNSSPAFRNRDRLYLEIDLFNFIEERML